MRKASSYVECLRNYVIAKRCHDFSEGLIFERCSKVKRKVICIFLMAFGPNFLSMLAIAGYLRCGDCAT
jgi:hypothetical protein